MRLGNPRSKNRYVYNEPQKPKSGKIKFKYDILGWTGSRAYYFENDSDGGHEELDYDEDNKSVAGVTEDHYISLKEVNDLVQKKGLDPSQVYFSASFADDWLHLEVVHVSQMSDQDQLEEYETQYSSWKEYEKLRFKYEEERIQRDIERLQEQAKDLKKLKK